VKLLGPDGPLTLRTGRQKLNYGDQRLIGSLAWANPARTYDGLKLVYKQQKVQVDAFLVHPISPPAGPDRISANEPDWSNHLYGLYGSIDILPDHVWEPYFIGHREHDRIIRDSTGRLDNFVTYTVGSRLVGQYADLDYGLEGAYQRGHWGDDKHRAWAVHARVGYTLSKAPWKPRVGVAYNFATGDDDPLDGRHKTFDNLFPTNHLFYGYIDFMGWRNMHNVRSSLSAEPVEGLKLAIDHHFFWRDKRTDAWYNAGGAPVRNALRAGPAATSVKRST